MFRIVRSLLALLLFVGAANAQLQTGNFYGTAIDEQGQPFPGVTVTLSGVGAPQTQVTNSLGQFRFLGLAPGSYDLAAEFDGPVASYTNFSIQVGRTTEIEIVISTPESEGE